MARIRRLATLVPPPSRGIVPVETLYGFVVTSPAVAILLVRSAVNGPWSLRWHVLVGAVAYASAIALCLHVAFNGLLARAPDVARRSPLRFIVYWLSAMLIAGGITRGFSPVFTWMGISLDSNRRLVQGSMIVSFFLAAAFLFKRATERIAHEQNRVLAERAAALDARLQALQARTNPHFLFNSLNSVMSLIGRDPDLAEQVLARLSTLLRYAIEGAERSHVSLREELNAVQDYMSIEQVRFGKRLRVTLDVGDDVNLGARVPPMVLQPLVENAILHAVARSVDGGSVRVAAANFAVDVVELVVDDEGSSEGAAPHTGTKTALSNLRERLRILYGEEASLTAGHRPSGGFRARLTIPTGPMLKAS